MLRALFRALFGRPANSAATQSPPPLPRWRTAPTKIRTTDLGGGVSVSLTVTTGNHGFLAVVGESHYQRALRSLVTRVGAGGVFTARLVPERSNPHDSNAVAVFAEGRTLEKVGYLTREAARTYQPRLMSHDGPVACPARLTGGGARMVGVVLDFDEVRNALGQRRVSVDQSDMNYEAAGEYHRLNNANREFVKETRALERSDTPEAVTRYRRAIAALCQCRDFARAKGLEAYGFVLNQTDATPIDRLTRCLLKMSRTDEAGSELDRFVEAFPNAREMTLIKAAMDRVNRARGRSEEGTAP
jgi:hypothetical protein